MILLPLILAGTSLLVSLLLWLSFRKDDSRGSLSRFPPVSILIAARNEERSMDACLRAVEAQYYPQEKMEILVGDDGSTDGTAEIIRAHARRDQRVRLISIRQDTEIGGKANVLAQLAGHSTGTYLVITDADTVTGSGWLAGLLTGWTPTNLGITNGVTAVRDQPYQDLEWLNTQAMIRTITDRWRPVTAIGNNMVISRAAYRATGGYEQIPFSLTEDYALFEAARTNGFTLRQRFSRDVLAETLPVRGFLALMHQRKRWMTGVTRLPLLVILLLFWQGMFLPMVIFLAFFHPLGALVLFLIKTGLQAVHFQRIYRLLDRKIPWVPVMFFEFYSGIMNILMPIFYLLPTGIRWKSREFKGGMKQD